MRTTVAGATGKDTVYVDIYFSEWSICLCISDDDDDDDDFDDHLAKTQLLLFLTNVYIV